MPQYDRTFLGIPLPGADLVPTAEELEQLRKALAQKPSPSSSWIDEDGKTHDWSEIY